MQSDPQTAPSPETLSDTPRDPSGGSPPELASADAAPGLPPSASPVAAEGLLAPDAERLPPCDGAARRIVDPDGGRRPSPVFLAVVSVITLASDIGSKLWAERRLEGYPGIVNVWENHLAFVLAKNKGGAWGLLQGTNENVRRPFFLLVSAAAIAFIVTLYRKLQPRQRALKWGLPLVLGGALGNVFDRIRYGHVIDFIDFRSDAVRKLNEVIGKYAKDHIVTEHWPTFNVADIAICVGVGLMAIDMFTSKKHAPAARHEPEPPLVGTLPGSADAGASNATEHGVTSVDEPPAPAAGGESKPESP
jgi:signal peptidase II